MEISQNAINIIIQVVANGAGFGAFLWLAKRQIDKKDIAFDKTVEVLNQLLTRVALVENNQDHMQDDIRELRNIPKVKQVN